MRVACIGECMVELTLPRERGGAGRVGFAGDTLNTAVYLKRSAPEIEVAYVTALGTDALSERMLGFFADEGLDTGWSSAAPTACRASTPSAVDAAGERSFTYWRDSSAARTLFLPPARGDAGAAGGLRPRLPLGHHARGPGAGGARALGALPARVPGARRPGRLRFELPAAALARRRHRPARDRRALGR